MTPDQLLDCISSVDFEADLVASTPRALRQMLLRRPEVRALRDIYDSGSLADEQIRRFVDQLLAHGTGSDRFPFQTALAAIAVMLEPRFSTFADEYLNDLARIRSDRFSMASRVARECLAERQQATKTEIRPFPPIVQLTCDCNWNVPADSKDDDSTTGYQTLRIA